MERHQGQRAPHALLLLTGCLSAGFRLSLAEDKQTWDRLSQGIEMQVRNGGTLLIHNAGPSEVVVELTNRNDRKLSGVARLSVPRSWRVGEGSNAPFAMAANGGRATATFSLRLRENVVPDVGEVPIVLRLFCGEDGILTKRLALKAAKVQEWLVLGPLQADSQADLRTVRPEEAFDRHEVVAEAAGRELRWRRVRTTGAIDLTKVLAPLPENQACQAVLCSYVSFCGSHDRKLKERFMLHFGSPNRAVVEVNGTPVLTLGAPDKEPAPSAPEGALGTGAKPGPRGVTGVMLAEGWNVIVVRTYKSDLEEKWSVQIDLTTEKAKYQRSAWYRYKTEERKD